MSLIESLEDAALFLSVHKRDHILHLSAVGFRWLLHAQTYLESLIEREVRP